MKKLLKRIVLLLYRCMVRILPIQKNVVILESNLGRNYIGNPRAIYEEILRRGLDQKFKCYYIFNDPKKIDLPGTGKKVKNSRLRYYYLMAVAGIWICDTRFQNYMIKRKGVTYIQTWHGTPLKKLALDMERVDMAETTDLEQYRQEFRKNSATWDYLISQNPFSTETFRRAFDFHGEILEIGYPRNDILFLKNSQEEILKLKRKLSLPTDRRIMLYAPTWRDNAYYDKQNYKFATEMNFEQMFQAFGKDSILLVKYHYMVQEKIDWSSYQGFIKEMDAKVDIAELYLVSDLLITDYSSVMFDYSLLHRPMFFYTYDLDHYKNQLRGFYFDLMKEAPGPVVGDTEELIHCIQDYFPEEYEQVSKNFYQTYNPFDDGHAAEKVVDLMVAIDSSTYTHTPSDL